MQLLMAGIPASLASIKVVGFFPKLIKMYFSQPI